MSISPIAELRSGTLYVVAMPIGRLRDITLRALDVLAGVDLIVAEDTRVIRVLLAAHGIHTPVMTAHLRDEEAAARGVLRALADGKAVALASDAGTPAVSDPGALVVAEVRAAGHPVVPVPGPNAAMALLSVAGLALPRWLFVGYLPPRKGERRSALEQVRSLPFGIVFHEAPHRIAKCAEDLAEILGADRRCVLGREITKRFEEFFVGRLGGLAEWLGANPERVRGEFTVVCEGAVTGAPACDPDRVFRVLAQDLAPAQAARLAAKITGEPRERFYRTAIAAKE